MISYEFDKSRKRRNEEALEKKRLENLLLAFEEVGKQENILEDIAVLIDETDFEPGKESDENQHAFFSNLVQKKAEAEKAFEEALVNLNYLIYLTQNVRKDLIDKNRGCLSKYGQNASLLRDDIALAEYQSGIIALGLTILSSLKDLVPDQFKAEYLQPDEDSDYTIATGDFSPLNRHNINDWMAFTFWQRYSRPLHSYSITARMSEFFDRIENNPDSQLTLAKRCFSGEDAALFPIEMIDADLQYINTYTIELARQELKEEQRKTEKPASSATHSAKIIPLKFDKK